MAGRADKNLARRFGSSLRGEIVLEVAPAEAWTDQKEKICEAVRLGLGSILSRPVRLDEIWSKNLYVEARP